MIDIINLIQDKSKNSLTNADVKETRVSRNIREAKERRARGESLWIKKK